MAPATIAGEPMRHDDGLVLMVFICNGADAVDDFGFPPHPEPI